MMQFEHLLVSRICHDLITPFNAIGLGIEAFDISGDPSLLKGVKASVEKANAILKFIRELYSAKEDSFSHSTMSLTRLTSDFMKQYNISLDLKSDLKNISGTVGKIIMHNAIVAKEIMPFGGAVDIKINGDENEIITTCSGKSLAIPNFDINDELSHKNIIRVSLLRLLAESGFEIIASQEEPLIIMKETRTV
ncbi:MAG: hypothetical protein LBF54_01525 [Holosporaceae bacterium]|jgi:hypothetical protein|nr:hypothetical protein [Holosporaceae bacterium]